VKQKAISEIRTLTYQKQSLESNKEDDRTF